MTQFLSMMVYFLTSFYSLSDIPVDQSIHLCASGWICSECRHANPENATRCEYCGKSK